MLEIFGGKMKDLPSTVIYFLNFPTPFVYFYFFQNNSLKQEELVKLTKSG